MDHVRPSMSRIECTSHRGYEFADGWQAAVRSGLFANGMPREKFGECVQHEMPVPVTNLGQGSVVQHPGVQIGYLGPARSRDGAGWSDICFS